MRVRPRATQGCSVAAGAQTNEASDSARGPGLTCGDGMGLEAAQEAKWWGTR